MLLLFGVNALGGEFIVGVLDNALDSLLTLFPAFCGDIDLHPVDELIEELCSRDEFVEELEHGLCAHVLEAVLLCLGG